MNIENQSNVTYKAAIPGAETTSNKLTSNAVNTEVLTYSVSKVLTTDKTSMKAGETAHNTVTVTNNSATKLFSTFISNLNPQGASYVEGSVKVNGVSQPTKNMISGFYLPDLNPGESLTVEYDIKIDNPATVTPVTDSSEFQWWVNDPAVGGKGEVHYREYTNAVSYDIISAKLSIVKSVNKTFAVKGDTLTYTVTITNSGTVNVTDVQFTDNIPQGTTFVANSVMHNGVNMPSYNPAVGYNIGNLSPAQSATTSFQVTVD